MRGGGDNGTYVTSYFYDANGTGNDYTHADSNVTFLFLPSGKLTTAVYDANYRKTLVNVADGTGDRAQTSYRYDNVGNLTSVVAPNEQPGQTYAGLSTITAYDERNRPYSVTDALQNTTTFTYDGAGRKKSINRPNGQSIVYNTFDSMNRVTQQIVYQNPSPTAITNYTYYPSGLINTMQDPQSNTYTYTPDQMGRKSYITYPLDSYGVHRVEHFTYDTAGRLYQFQNRTGYIQTFSFDWLNRMTGFSWNDSVTPNVAFGYDDLSRLRSVTNANATISRYYFNDNLLSAETTTYPSPDNVARSIQYTYDPDGNRAAVQYPANAGSFTYNYTGRNQLQSILDNNNKSAPIATYWYDINSNLHQRNPGNNVSTSSYDYDALDRVVNITHLLNSGSRRLEYGYDNVSNRLWTWRDNGNGDTFSYDLNDQVVGVALDVPNPNLTPPPAQSISYDANGNRLTFAPYGTTDTYSTNGNSLNQYSTRNLTQQAAYNANGDMTTGFDGSTYTYDAQNRLLRATKNGTTDTFAYDGLNRQVIWTSAAPTSYSVYDGWDLIGDYMAGQTTPTNTYIYGAGGLVKLITTFGSFYYFQDASGSTSHLADSNGNLVEWYRYDLQGTPIFYNHSNQQILSSEYGVRHLFTGQQWYGEIGLYDLRNRYYSPDIGRFLQADPIGFGGDATNLYRYCGNNPLMRSDPSGLADVTKQYQNAEGVVVTGPETLPTASEADPSGQRDLLPGEDQFGGLPGEGGLGDLGRPGGFALGPALPVNPYTPPNPLQPNPFNPAPTSAPTSTSLLALPSLTNTTYFVGFSLTGIVGWGGTAQVGIYGGPNGVGIYYNGGQGNGVEVAPPPPNVVAGYVNGPFDGPFVNSNFGALTYGASAFHNSFGQTVGYGISLGPQLTPVFMSTTYTNTSTTPPVQPPIFIDPVVLPGH